MKTNDITWPLAAFCFIPLIIGLVMLALSTTEREYPTSKYYLSSDETRVCDKQYHRTVDYISDNETCFYSDEAITVRTERDGLFFCGMFIAVLFGMCSIGWIACFIQDTKLWKSIVNKVDEYLDD